MKKLKLLLFALLITGAAFAESNKDTTITKNISMETVKTLDLANLKTSGLTGQDLFKIGNTLKNSNPNTQESDVLAAKCFQAGSLLGDGNSIIQLGEMYITGKIPLQEGQNKVQEAVKLWNIAISMGLGQAYHNMGMLYLGQEIPGTTGVYGKATELEYREFIEKDYLKAIEFFNKGLEKGYAKSARYIGVCYEQGFGVKQDYTLAAKYFEMSANMGDSTTKLYLANYLLEGKGIKQDIPRALEILNNYIVAKGQFTGDFAFRLGQIYDEGIYLKKDKEKAMSYYLLALSNKNTEVKKVLESTALDYYNQGISLMNKGNTKESMKLIYQAANLGNNDALNLLK